MVMSSLSRLSTLLSQNSHSHTLFLALSFSVSLLFSLPFSSYLTSSVSPSLSPSPSLPLSLFLCAEAWTVSQEFYIPTSSQGKATALTVQVTQILATNETAFHERSCTAYTHPEKRSIIC